MTNPNPPLSTTGAPATDPRLILIAEDNELVRVMLRMALERGGYTVLEAKNGYEALALFRAHLPLCVITDILMPDKEGLETIRELRAEVHRAPIIAMTGESDAQSSLYLRVAREFGADVVLEKPFSIERLLMHVDRLIKGSSVAAP